MEEAEAHLREMQEELSNLKALIEHTGWKWLLELADDQVKNRLPSALSKIDNLLEVTKNEFEKGEISGIKLFMKIPEMQIEMLEQAIEQITEELEDGGQDREARKSRESGDSGIDGDTGDEFIRPV